MSEPQDPPAVEPPASPTAIPDGPQTAPPTAPLTRREAREAARADEATTLIPSLDPSAQETRLIPAAFPLDPGAPGTVGPTVAIPFAVAPPTTVLRAPVPAESGGARPATRGGVFATIAKHPNAWLFSALGLVFALLATGSIFAGIAVGSSAVSPVVAAASASPTPTRAPTRPVPVAIAPATHLRTCSVATLASDPNLLTFQGSVINATTGEVLFDRNGATPSRTASVLKTLTAAAALAVLGPDYRISTTVVAGSAPGTIVLVGGGDPTLSAVGAGQESIYRGAPKLSDLAKQVQANWTKDHAEAITNIVLDSSLWNPNDNWDPTWERSEQSQGYQPEVTALTVDGGRANPLAQDSTRSSDPIMDAGKAFATALGIGGAAQLTLGIAPAGAKPLGEVKSQPVRMLVSQMLPVSDNALGEYLARVTSKVAGSDGSSASLARVIPTALAKYGLATTGVAIRDGSGLSNNNAVPATFVAQLMAKVAGGQQNLNIIYDALPIAGKTGTLAGRFSGANAVARGAVNAKTGWIKTEYSLAGVVHAADGTTLSFAFYALGAINSRTQPALDTITTGIFKCGNNLSNN